MMFDKLLSFEDIKNEPFIIEHIRWDIRPKDLMEPKYRATEKGLEVREEIKGYVFYIDTMGTKPALFLMRHTAAEFAETLAQIDEVPGEWLFEAVEENKSAEYFNMYPINKKIEEWLKKELGVR